MSALEQIDDFFARVDELFPDETAYDNQSTTEESYGDFDDDIVDIADSFGTPYERFQAARVQALNNEMRRYTPYSRRRQPLIEISINGARVQAQSVTIDREFGHLMAPFDERPEISTTVTIELDDIQGRALFEQLNENRLTL